MPTPNRKDASALASAAGGAPKASEPAPAAASPAAAIPARRERVCKWADDSQFNLESWVAGKLRATVEVYDIPGVGKLELTFRELSGQENREIDAMMARAVAEQSVFSEGDVMRFRNVAITAASIVAINGKPWPEMPKTDKDPEGKRRMSVEARDSLLREQTKQTMLDLYVKATADFQDQVLQLVQGVDPKLFASPSGSSARRSPSGA